MRISRRDFLRATAIMAGGLACRLSNTPLPTVMPTADSLLDPSRSKTLKTSPSPSPTPTQYLSPSPANTDMYKDTPTPVGKPTSVPETNLSIPLFTVDAHEDIAWNWLEFGRDPAASAIDARILEAGTGVPLTIGQRTTGLPQWLEGRIGIIFATIFVMPSRYAYRGWQTQSYTTEEEAYALASFQMEKYKELADQQSQIDLVSTRRELEDVIASWTTTSIEKKAATVGLVISMEGAEAIRDPADVHQWYAQGLRIIGPAWAATRYSGGTSEPGPLTDLGRQLLAEMATTDMILDLSHMAESAFLEAVETYDGELIASHSNPRRFLPTDRGLSHDMIRRLASRGGVIGITPYNRYLKPGWQIGNSRAEVPIQTVGEAIDYIVQLTGSTKHVGIGSDFDGGFGLESLPAGMDTVADLHKVAEVLSARGYGPADIEMIMNGNWLRILRQSLPEESVWNDSY